MQHIKKVRTQQKTKEKEEEVGDEEVTSPLLEDKYFPTTKIAYCLMFIKRLFFQIL